MSNFELFQLYLHHVTPNSFLFFVEKTCFAFCFVYSLNATSPGPLLKNRILVLVHGTPVLMSPVHYWCLRIMKIADTAVARTSFFGMSPHKSPCGATRLHPFRGRVWSRRDQGGTPVPDSEVEMPCAGGSNNVKQRHLRKSLQIACCFLKKFAKRHFKMMVRC